MKKIREIARRPRIVVLLALAASFALAFVVGCASTQPHMQSALDQLSAARTELEAAVSTKGGHRERAIQLIDEATREVELGMQLARHR